VNVRPSALLVLAAQSQNRQSFRADLGRPLRTGNLVNRLSRLVATSGLAVLCLGATALAQDSLFDLAPPSASGSFLAGTQALNELRTPEASRFFADAIAEEWDNPIILNRAFVAFAANGEVERASDTAARILELEPANELAQLVRATEAIKQRRYEAALRALDKVGEDSFEGITGTILRAWALTGLNRMPEGQALLDKIAGNGLDEFLVYHRAMMAEVAGDREAAQAYVQQAIEADPLNADVVEAFARIMGNSGHFAEALDAIVTFEAQGLTHPLVTDVKQKLAQSRAPGPYATSIESGVSRMFHSIGVGFAREGTSDFALVLERLAQYLDPRSDTVAVVVGQLYDMADQHELANAAYDAVPVNSLLKPMATVRVAGNLDAMGDRSEAIRRLTNIVTTNPEDIEAVSVLGDLLRTDKQYVASAEAYSKALAITGGKSPGDWRFFYVRGISYERADLFPKAEADFLRALELNPDQPQVLNYLGYSWVDKGLHLDRALGLIEKAIEESPNDGYIIDSLGWAYYRLGRFPEAVEKLEQAALLLPNDPEINDHLGDAYWRVGRKLEASFQWKVAYAMDEEGNVRKRIEPKLAAGLDAAPVTEDSAPVEPVPGEQASVD
jgi:tetratricopeptide (TPR) repeat protein